MLAAEIPRAAKHRGQVLLLACAVGPPHLTAICFTSVVAVMPGFVFLMSLHLRPG